LRRPEVRPHKQQRGQLHRSTLGVNDASRAAKIVEGAKGNSLLYRRPDESPLAPSP